ncbi:Eukaryotic translation initiation factor 5 [Diplonema papillatum]|nr:Eukaryotic translation initiation factor 5 [Diplonema papillatum]
MALLTINPEKQDDPFYRYKMPPLQTKIEGGGNGIKTVLPNVEEVAKRLNRDPAYPMKHLGNSLGVASKLEDAKWILMGEHNKDTLQKVLFEYVLKFVLCKNCGNPETDTHVDKKKNITLCCAACGAITDVSPNEKLCNLILKKEPITDINDLKREKKEKKDKADKKEKKDKADKKEKKEKKSKKDKKEGDFEGDFVAAADADNPFLQTFAA